MTKFAVVIFPTKKIQDAANSYRKRYDTKYHLIPPHMTIRSPFEISDEDVHKISGELKDIAKKVKPFPIEILRFGCFHPVNNVIFFRVEPIDELQSLHDDMYSGSFPTEQQYAFVPHITVGQNLANGETADIYGQLHLKNIYFEDIVERFHLVYELDNNMWSVLETFHLGKD